MCSVKLLNPEIQVDPVIVVSLAVMDCFGHLCPLRKPVFCVRRAEAFNFANPVLVSDASNSFRVSTRSIGRLCRTVIHIVCVHVHGADE